MGLVAPAGAGGGARGRGHFTAERLEHLLHPWASLVIVPIFALANSGVSFSGDSVRAALSSPITLGVVVGLVVGKAVGITGASWIACRAGLAELPSGTSWRDLVGVGVLGGIGFTVSLFITELAFGATALAEQAKVGIFAASIAATIVAALVFRVGRRQTSHG
jgi:Na+/H+ antiporter NhaA